MSYAIKCKIETPSYNGFGYIHVPNIDAPYSNYGYQTDTWLQCVEVAGDGTFDIIAPQYDWSVSGLSRNNIFNDKIKYNNHGQVGDVYKYTIYSNDNHERIIKNTISSMASEGRFFGYTTEFIIDGVTKLSVDTPSAFGKEVSASAYETTERTYFSTFPWLGKINGVEYVIRNEGAAYVVYNNATNKEDRYGFSFAGSTSYGAEYVTAFKEWVNGYEPIEIDPYNPYWTGGVTGSTEETDGWGGPGNFSDDSDYPVTDDLPTLSAVGTGMATIFKPSQGQLRNLANLMWNSNFFTFMQNLVENISDMFTSLAMVPFNVTAGSTVSVTWLGFDTAVSLTLAAQQFYQFDMGTIDLASDGRIFTSGSALDYAPFSQLGIYLPFIGYRDLDIDECRGTSINLRYRIDILSGACVAIIKVGGKDIYEFTGNCLAQIPITNESMQSLVSDAVNVGLAIAGAEAAGAVASGVEADAAAANEALSEEKSAHLDQMVRRSRSQLASATANAAMGMKPKFTKSGAVSGSVAMMAVKQPYLFLRTPRQAIPDKYERYCGFPSNITGRLGDFSGYTVVEDIRLNGLVATSTEVAEIYKLLKSGVII